MEQITNPTHWSPFRNVQKAMYKVLLLAIKAEKVKNHWYEFDKSDLNNN